MPPPYCVGDAIDELEKGHDGKWIETSTRRRYKKAVGSRRQVFYGTAFMTILREKQCDLRKDVARKTIVNRKEMLMGKAYDPPHTMTVNPNWFTKRAEMNPQTDVRRKTRKKRNPENKHLAPCENERMEEDEEEDNGGGDIDVDPEHALPVIRPSGDFMTTRLAVIMTNTYSVEDNAICHVEGSQAFSGPILQNPSSVLVKTDLMDTDYLDFIHQLDALRCLQFLLSLSESPMITLTFAELCFREGSRSIRALFLSLVLHIVVVNEAGGGYVLNEEDVDHLQSFLLYTQQYTHCFHHIPIALWHYLFTISFCIECVLLPDYYDRCEAVLHWVRQFWPSGRRSLSDDMDQAIHEPREETLAWRRRTYCAQRCSEVGIIKRLYMYDGCRVPMLQEDVTRVVQLPPSLKKEMLVAWLQQVDIEVAGHIPADVPRDMDFPYPPTHPEYGAPDDQGDDPPDDPPDDQGDAPPDAPPDDQGGDPPDAPPDAPVRRPRGRPRKNPTLANPTATVRRPRGRPRNSATIRRRPNRNLVLTDMEEHHENRDPYLKYYPRKSTKRF
jgi:hypothetical protein